MSPLPLVVSVHALDAGGGDGCISDAGVTAELDCRSRSVATSVTFPEALPLAVFARQLEAAAEDGPVAAVRIGFLRGADQAELLGHALKTSLAAPSVLAIPAREQAAPGAERDAILRHLYPAARVVVVRAAELAALTGQDVEDLAALRHAAAHLRERGARAVVIAGWLRRGRVVDLVDDGGNVALLDAPRVQAPRVFGLAGAYAAALASHLAHGLPLREAADAAQRYIGLRLMRGR